MPANKFKALAKEADAAFKGTYKDELNKLAALSKDEIDAITPGEEDMKEYFTLMKVVEQASRDNLKQAELAANIKALGAVAINIAKKVPGLSAIL
jgi:hypothetical protein